MKIAGATIFARLWYICSTIFCADWYILFTAQKIGIKSARKRYLSREIRYRRGSFLLSSDKVEIYVRNIVIFDFFSRCEILCGCDEIPVTVQNFRDAGGEESGKCFFC